MKIYPEDYTTATFLFNTTNVTTATVGAPVAPSTAFDTTDFRIHKNGSAVDFRATMDGVTVSSPFDSEVGCHRITIDLSNDTGDTDFWELGASYDIRFNTSKTVDSVSLDGRKVPNSEFMIRNLATTEQVDTIGASSGGSINFAPIEDNTAGAIVDSVLFVGSVVSGTFASVGPGTDTHSINDTANDIDIVYGYQVGGSRQATAIEVRADVDGNGDEVVVKVYDHVGASWDTLGTITNDTTLTASLVSKHTGTGAELGKVYLRFDTDATTPSNLEVTECLVSAVTVGSTVGYSDGAVWVDTVNGVAGTEINVNGVADNPTNSWANALTIAAAKGLKRFHIAGGSSITLTGNSDNYVLMGDGLFDLDLGNQSIANAYIYEASISGTGSGSGAVIEDCRINNNASTGPAFFVRCGFGTVAGNPFLSNGAGEYVLVDCVSVVPGQSSPYFDFSGELSSSGVSFRRWSGGTNITLDANNTLSLEIIGGGGQTITCGGADVEIRGIFREATINFSAAETLQAVGVYGEFTLNGATTGGGATLNLAGVSCTVTDNTTGSGTTVNRTGLDGPRFAEILQDTGTDIPNSITALSSEVADVKTQLTRAEWVKLMTSAGTIETCAVDTVVNTHTPTPTEFQSDSITAPADNHFNGRIIIFTSGVLQGQASDITDYTLVGGIGQFTVTGFTTAPANDDEFIII